MIPERFSWTKKQKCRRFEGILWSIHLGNGRTEEAVEGMRLRAVPGEQPRVMHETILFRRYHGDNLSFASWPEKDPCLRSLKAKLDRSRPRQETGAE